MSQRAVRAGRAHATPQLRGPGTGHGLLRWPVCILVTSSPAELCGPPGSIATRVTFLLQGRREVLCRAPRSDAGGPASTATSRLPGRSPRGLQDRRLGAAGLMGRLRLRLVGDGSVPVSLPMPLTSGASISLVGPISAQPQVPSLPQLAREVKISGLGWPGLLGKLRARLL